MSRTFKLAASSLALLSLFLWSVSIDAAKVTRDSPSSNNGVCTAVYTGCPSGDIFFLDSPYSAIPLSGGGLSATVTMLRSVSFFEGYNPNPQTYVPNITIGQTVISVSLSGLPAGAVSQNITAVGIAPPSGAPLVNPWYANGGRRTGFTNPFGFYGMVTPGALSPTASAGTIALPFGEVDLISAAAPVVAADGNTNLWSFDPNINTGNVSLLVDGYPDNRKPAGVIYPTDLPSSATVSSTTGNGLIGLTAANIALIVHVVFADGSSQDVNVGGLALAGGLAACPNAVSGVTCHPNSAQPITLSSSTFSETTRLDNISRSAGELTYPTTPPTCANFQTSGAAGLARALTYQLKPTSSQAITIDTSGSHFDTVLLVTSPDDPAFATPQCNDDQTDQIVQAKLAHLQLTAGKTYNIVVGEYPAFTEHPCPLGSTGTCTSALVPAPLSTDPVLNLSISAAGDVTGTTVTCTPITTPALQPVSCTATLADTTLPGALPTGSVQFAFASTISGSLPSVITTVPISGTTATTTTSALYPGTYNVTATYQSSNPQYAVSSGSFSSVAVQLIPSTITAALSGPAYAGFSAFLTVNLSSSLGTGAFDGTVSQLLTGTTFSTSTSFTGSQATLQVFSQLGVGSYSTTVSYSGNALYAPSSTTLQYMVTERPSAISLAASEPSIALHGSLTLTAAVGPLVPVLPPLTSTTATGNVIFYDGATSLGTVPLTAGAATFTTTTASNSLGPQSITAQYIGDTNYSGSTSTAVPVAVVSYATSTTASASSLTPFVGQTGTFTATLTRASGTVTPTGTFTLLKSGVAVGTSIPVGTSSTSLPVSFPAQGYAVYTVQYSGDANYAASTSAAIPLTAGQSQSATSVSGPASVGLNAPINLTATVTNTSGSGLVPDGTAYFSNGTTSLGSAPLTAGTASISTSLLSAIPGTYSIVAGYGGSTNFNYSNSATIQVVVLPAAATSTSISVSSSTPVAGSSITITGAVNTGSSSRTPTGTLTLLDGTTPVGSPVSVASAAPTFTVNNLAAGTHSYTIVYSGDTNYATSTSAAAPVLAGKDASSVILASSVATVAVNGPITLAATVGNASGTTLVPGASVTFLNGTTTLGTAPLTAGKATLTTSAASAVPGTLSLTAQYLGDTNFTTSISPAVAVNVLYPTSTTVSISPINAVAGVTLTISPTLTHAAGTLAPSGTLTLFDGNAAVGSPLSLVTSPLSFSVTNLTAGPHSYSLQYSGDTVYAASTSATSQFTVGKDGSSLTLISSAASVAPNGSITLTATASNTSATSLSPSGTVTFLSGTSTLGTATLTAGKATLTTSAATAVSGAFTLSAQYAGDTSFNTSTSSSVPLIVLYATSTSALLSPATAVAGSNLTIAASLSKGSGTQAPTGTYTLLDGVAAVGSPLPVTASVVTFSVASVTVGTHSYTVQYSGDTLYAASTSAATQAVIGKASSATVLGPLKSSVNQNAAISLTATVTNASQNTLAPSGTVTFLGNGAAIGSASIANGVAILTAPSFTSTAGVYAITAQYAGDTNFNASTTAAVSVTVVAPDFSLLAEQPTITLSAGQTGTSRIDLTAVGGFVQTVAFTCSGQPVHSACAFSPSSLTPDAAGDLISSTLTISTNTVAASLSPQTPGRALLPVVLAAGLLWIATRRKKALQSLRNARILAALILGVLALSLSACASSSGFTQTPAGTYSIVVAATGSGAPSRNVTVQVTVTK